jgi:cell division transport system permease protein
MRALSYAFREALVSMRRGGRSAVVSIVTIAIAFLTLGVFLLISFNLQRVAEQWAQAAEMSVYLDESLDEAGRTALTSELQQQAAVAAVEYVSKESALERFRQDFPELADLASGDNPFPSSLEVRLHSEPGAGDAAAALAASLADRAGVADVRYDRQWLARLLAAVASIRVGGLIVAAVLVLGAAFTVAAVVRLSLESRHAELDIMQLVGAPSAFVRGPFVAEGTLLGGLGALVAVLSLWALYSTLRTQAEDAITGIVRVGAFAFLPASDVLLLLGAGLLVGAAAGVIASRMAR